MSSTPGNVRINLAVLAIVLLAVAVTASTLQRATIDEGPTLTQMLGEHERQQLARFRARFPTAAEHIIVAIPRSGPVTPNALAELDKALAGIVGIDQVLSAFTDNSALLPQIRSLVATGEADLMLLMLAPGSHDLATAKRIVVAIEATLAAVLGDANKALVVGLPQIRVASWEVSRADATKVLPVLVVLTVGIALLFFKSAVALGLALLLTSLTTMCCLLLYVAVFGVLPALLIIVVPVVWAIATLDAFHLYSRTAYYARRGYGSPARAAAASLFGPCLLTTLTTAACFLSLAWFENSPLIFRFGVLSCIGTLIAFALTFTLGRKILSLYEIASDGPRWARAIPFCAVRAAQRKPVATALIWLLLALTAVAGWPRLQVESAFPDVFSRAVPLGQHTARLASITGTDLNPIELIVVPVDSHGQAPGQLAAAVQLTHNYLQTLAETRLVLPLGLVSPERISEFTLDKSSQEYLAGPDGFEESFIRHWVSGDRRLVRLQAYLAPADFARKQELFGWIAHFDDTMLDHHRVYLSGPGYFYPATEERGLQSLFWSSALSVLFLSAAMVWLARERHTAMAALSGCTVPAVVVVGVMGWCGLPWSIALLPMPALLLGLMNDDAIHMAWGVGRERPKSLQKNAVAAGPALMATTAVLAAAVGALNFSGIQTNQYLGVLVPLGLVLALLCNLTLLPAISSLWRK